jgi:histidinol dehydrogenase
VLVTADAELAASVERELVRLAASTTHSERVTAAITGKQSAIVLVDDLAAAADFSNAFGPEHLEIQTENPEGVLELIENAGAIFLGENSPVSLGDYSAGSNHVLPTGGQARFSAGLSASTFLRPQQVVRYSREALAEVHQNVLALSDAEALPAHGDAITARFA